jgi:hypothetical protein
MVDEITDVSWYMYMYSFMIYLSPQDYYESICMYCSTFAFSVPPNIMKVSESLVTNNTRMNILHV